MSTIDLDHVIFQISFDGLPEAKPPINRVLNRWISDKGRRSPRQRSSDYSWKAFRRELERNGIPRKFYLQTSDPGTGHSLVLLQDQHQFHIFLTGLQRGLHGMRDNPDLLICMQAVPPPDGAEAEFPDDEDDSTDVFTDDSSIEISTPTPRRVRKGKDKGKGKDKEKEKEKEKNDDSPADKGKGKEKEKDGDSPADKEKGKEKEKQNDGGPIDDTIVGMPEPPEESSEEEEPEEGDGRTAIARRLGLQDRGISDADWTTVCTFFQCLRDVENLRIPGARLPLIPYQMHGVFFNISQASRGISASIIADDVGLGKTGMTLVTLLLHEQLQNAMVEVENEWRLAGYGRQKHLPESQGPKNTVCPNQGDFPYQFQCPCIKSGIAYRIAKSLPPFPSLIVCPPGLIDTWVAEIEKWMDFGAGIMKNYLVNRLSFTVAHNNWMNGDKDKENIKYHGHDAVAETTAIRLVGKMRRLDYKRELNNLPCRRVIIASNVGVAALLQKYNHKRFAAGIVVFDEVHGYRGSREKPTQAFQALEEMAITSKHRTLAIGLSASLIGNGPIGWRPFLVHIFNQTAHLKAQSPFNIAMKKETVDKWENDFNYLVSKLGNTDMETDTALQSRFDSFSAAIANFIPEVILARTASSRFRGKRISERERAPHETIPCDMQDGPVRTAHQRLAANIRDYIESDFHRRMQEWIKGGRQGEEPQRDAVQRDYLDSIVKPGILPPGDRSYEVLYRSSCFPAVARIYGEGKVEYRHFLRDSIETIASQATAVDTGGNTRPGRRTQLLEVLAKSPFWGYRRELRETSPKFDIVVENIQKIIELKNSKDKDGPSDGSQVRHMLVFTDSQLSAFLMFMLLTERYPSQIEIVYIHGGMASPERSALLNKVQQPCKNTDLNKVVVSNFNFIGQGLNLQRANYAIITEMPRAQTVQRQAFGRVDRRGQTQKTVLLQLYDKRNLAERVRYERSQARAQLEGVAQAVGELKLEEFLG